MLTPQDIEIAVTRALLAVDTDQSVLASEIRSAISIMNHGGGMIRAVQDLCAQEAARRVAATWDVLHHVLINVRLEHYADVRIDISSAFQQCLIDDSAEMVRHIGSVCAACRFADTARFVAVVDQSRARALAKVDSDILIFVRHLQTTPLSSSTGPTFNIHNSNVSGIQTGAGSIANFSVQIHADGSNAVLSALDLVVAELSSLHLVSEDNKTSILEIVEESRLELAKEKPNSLKLSGLIGAIVNGVSLLADASPAVQTLMLAATAIGLM